MQGAKPRSNPRKLAEIFRVNMVGELIILVHKIEKIEPTVKKVLRYSKKGTLPWKNIKVFGSPFFKKVSERRERG